MTARELRSYTLDAIMRGERPLHASAKEGA